MSNSAYLALSYAALTILPSIVINRTVQLPYIDEIFHVPQARLICEGAREYDPKLTTPPGLYLLSLGLSKVMPGVQCKDLDFLRSTNLILLLCLPHLLAAILQAREGELDRRAIKGDQEQTTAPYTGVVASAAPLPRGRGIPRSTIAALQRQAQSGASTPPASINAVLSSPANQAKLQRSSTAPYRLGLGCTLSLLPPLYFFGFLYYTDVGSVFFVLLTLYLLQRRQTLMAAGCGCVSLLFRQTNVVWLLFVLLRQVAGDAGLYSLVDLPRVWTRRGVVLRGIAPFLPVFAGFAWFIRWNGGIVLGDKANHQASIHTPQIFYFLLFATGFGWPALRLPKLRHALLGVSLVPLATWAAARQTITHPFMLADNRHYTFYLWRIFLRFEWIRYALVPVYAAAAAAWSASSDVSQIEALGFVTALALTLIPAPLVEPRYFFTGYVILRLSVRSTPRRLIIEASWAILINAVTLYLFLFRPFTWQASGVDASRNESTVMRFMW